MNMWLDTPSLVPGEQPRLLDLCGGEGGAAYGYVKAGFHVTSVDLDKAALKRSPAHETVHQDALLFLALYWRDYDVFHLSAPCQRWAANNANSASDKWPDLITPGRLLLTATRRPWVMENVQHAPLRHDAVLCGSMFGLTATDTDGTLLSLQRHRYFESNAPISSPGPCRHEGVQQWAGVYGALGRTRPRPG